jgi:nucleotide-binding universal stress UspA family protein
METRKTRSMAEASPAASKPLFRKILVAMDGSESSQRAAQVALELAEKLKAELIVLHGVSPPASYYRSALASPGGIIPPSSSQHEIDAYYAYAKRVALEIVGETESKAKKRGIPVKIEIPEAVSSVVETIINHAAKESIDLIVVGSRGLGGFKKMLIGSVSSGVISHAPCPVLVVR